MPSAVYPNIFKISKTRPIHKKGSHRDFFSYRQASMLFGNVIWNCVQNLSNVFGNVIWNHVQNLCRTSNFLAKNQFSLRKNRNAELATYSRLDKLPPALEEKSYAIRFFLDSSACFDTLSHSIQNDKLEKYCNHVGCVFGLSKLLN